MITNAQIVGADIAPERYDQETEQRGSAKFTVRSHTLNEILRNAQRWMRGYESPESKSKDFGRLLDCLLLTPLQWPTRFAVLPADAPKKPSKTQINAKKPSDKTLEDIKWWDAWTKANPGEIVSQETNGSVHAAIKRLREDAMICDLIDNSQHAVMLTAVWDDHGTGLMVPLKALVDIAPRSDHPVFGNSLWDLKTTQNASPRSFSRDAQKYGYAVQAAFYVDMWNAAHPSPADSRSDFGHVVVESFHPFEYRTPPPLLSQRFLGVGRALYQKALAIYCKAICSGDWPGYDGHSKDWPLTDCDDFYCTLGTIYEDLDEPGEAPEEKIADLPDDVPV